MDSGSQNVASVTSAGVKILIANTLRTAVTFSTPKMNRVTLSNLATPVAAQGLCLQPGTAPRTFTLDDLGSWLTGDVFAITDAGTEQIGWVEVLCQPDKYQ